MNPYDLSAWNVQNPSQQYQHYGAPPCSYPGGFDISSGTGYPTDNYRGGGFGSGPSVGFILPGETNPPYDTGPRPELNAYPFDSPNPIDNFGPVSGFPPNPSTYESGSMPVPYSGPTRQSFGSGFNSGFPLGQPPTFPPEPSRAPSIPASQMSGYPDSFAGANCNSSYGGFSDFPAPRIPNDSFPPSISSGTGYPSIGDLRNPLPSHGGINGPFTNQGKGPAESFGFHERAPHEDVYEPTIKAAPNFNCEEDCERLKKAMHGMGTDEKVLIEIMGGRSSEQRVQIVNKYKSLFGKSLIDKLKSETSRHFKDTLEALCYSMTEYDARELRRAVEGAGTDEDALIEILCTRTNKQLKDIKQCYSEIFKGRDLEKDIINDTSRHFKNLLVALLQANRDESTTFDRNAARRDAEELYRAGEKKLGTDESRFIAILGSRSYAHLRGVFEEYEKISKKTMEAALKSEMHGDLVRAVLAIVRSIMNKPKFFATKLFKAMHGAGTDDHTLIRIIVSRSEIDLGRIKKEFLQENAKTLEAWVHDDTTGDYRKLLLQLVNGNCSS